MEGKRKMVGYYITTAILTGAFVWTMITLGKVSADGGSILQLFTTYVVMQGSMTGAFFGFNFGEHWAKAKLGK